LRVLGAVGVYFFGFVAVAMSIIAALLDGFVMKELRATIAGLYALSAFEPTKVFSFKPARICGAGFPALAASLCGLFFGEFRLPPFHGAVMRMRLFVVHGAWAAEEEQNRLGTFSTHFHPHGCLPTVTTITSAFGNQLGRCDSTFGGWDAGHSPPTEYSDLSAASTADAALRVVLDAARSTSTSTPVTNVVDDSVKQSSQDLLAGLWGSGIIILLPDGFSQFAASNSSAIPSWKNTSSDHPSSFDWRSFVRMTTRWPRNILSFGISRWLASASNRYLGIKNTILRCRFVRIWSAMSSAFPPCHISTPMPPPTMTTPAKIIAHLLNRSALAFKRVVALIPRNSGGFSISQNSSITISATTPIITAHVPRSRMRRWYCNQPSGVVGMANIENTKDPADVIQDPIEHTLRKIIAVTYAVLLVLVGVRIWRRAFVLNAKVN
jgi:hypothetical protein